MADKLNYQAVLNGALLILPENLSIGDVMITLLAKCAIDQNDKERIEKQYSNRDQVATLLQLLKKKQFYSYDVFMKVLEKQRPDLHKEVKALETGVSQYSQYKSIAGRDESPQEILFGDVKSKDVAKEIKKTEDIGKFQNMKLTEEQEDEVRIVVLGHTGDGKSSSCSSIAMERGAFISSVSASSETEFCTHLNRNILGVNLVIVDTPGLFDTEHDIEVTTKEIAKCMLVAAPGPHAFIYVVQIGSKFTKELQDTLRRLRELFGSGCTDYMLVVFCGMDNLKYDQTNINTLQEFIYRAPAVVSRLVSDCGGRVVGFNNRCETDSDENKKQVKELLDEVNKIRKMRADQGPCYTSGMLREAERIMKERDEAIRKEHERKRAAEMKMIETRHKNEFDKKLRQIQAEMQKNLQKREAKFQIELEKTKQETLRQVEMKRKQEVDRMHADMKENQRQRDEAFQKQLDNAKGETGRLKTLEEERRAENKRVEMEMIQRLELQKKAFEIEKQRAQQDYQYRLEEKRKVELNQLKAEEDRKRIELANQMRRDQQESERRLQQQHEANMNGIRDQNRAQKELLDDVAQYSGFTGAIKRFWHWMWGK
ncbi:uncharacterized protein [Amphiura filiformis]|uniref:uncharacterized protein n=1 Tax=Amphiura filiformis TaxID=82378 RepID=UPI003B21F5F5